MEHEARIIITQRTITVTQRVPLSDYGGMNTQEAIGYEKDMPKGDAIQAVCEALEFGAVSEIKTESYWEYK